MRTTLLIVSCLLLLACSSGMPPKTAPVEPQGSGSAPCVTSIAQAPRSFIYRFEIGDELAVDVYQEPDLTTELRVLPDGTINPQLVGSMHVAGRTVEEAREMLRRKYLDYLKEPVVSVRVTRIYSDRVFVLGEVITPQSVELVGPLTLVQAVSQAAGFKEEFADKATVRLIRAGPDGQPLVQVVNVDAVLAARAVDPRLQRGDVIFVPARGVTNWNRSLGQALAPFAVALGAAGSTAAIISVTE